MAWQQPIHNHDDLLTVSGGTATTTADGSDRNDWIDTAFVAGLIISLGTVVFLLTG